MNNIVFTLYEKGHTGPLPTPSSEALPEWYKNTSPYLPESLVPKHERNPIRETIKKCMPVFDSMTAGYMLYTPCDVVVTTVNGAPYFEWNSDTSTPAVSFHISEQARLHPKVNSRAIPKWINRWVVKTPKGYSCLFIAPMNSDKSPFTIFPGVVDTDTFTAPVNLPFTLNNPNFNGLIPEGTPMCQIVPFKREEWEMSLGSEKEFKESDAQNWRLRKLPIFSYKKSWWNRKSYK